jgi:hypothetical protein
VKKRCPDEISHKGEGPISPTIQNSKPQGGELKEVLEFGLHIKIT